MKERNPRGRWRSRFESGISKESDPVERLVVIAGLSEPMMVGSGSWLDLSDRNRKRDSTVGIAGCLSHSGITRVPFVGDRAMM